MREVLSGLWVVVSLLIALKFAFGKYYEKAFLIIDLSYIALKEMKRNFKTQLYISLKNYSLRATQALTNLSVDCADFQNSLLPPGLAREKTDSEYNAL